MNKQEEQQNTYKKFVGSVIDSDTKLSSACKGFKFESSVKVAISVSNRESFKTLFECYLKKHKVSYSSKIVSGSGFAATIIDFQKFVSPSTTLKPLTIQYKNVGSGSSGNAPPRVKTAWQELGAAYIFDQALVKNVNYATKLDRAMKKFDTPTAAISKKILPKDVLLETFKDELPTLRKLFEDRSTSGFLYIDWLNSFYFSQKVLLARYASPKFSSFNRDGGFMEYITKLINVKFGISKKDTWNPADVWAIKGITESIEKTIEKELKNIDDYTIASTSKKTAVELDNYIRAGVLKLNSILIDLLTGPNPRLVGISLKLTDSGAHIEEVNFAKVKTLIKKNKHLIDTIADPFCTNPKTDWSCNFQVTSGKSSKGTFTQDIKISTKDTKTGNRYNFQIKANSSESPNGSNLKFELSIQGKGSARGGKVPVELVVALVNKINRGAFVNDYTKYPRTSKEFEDKDYKNIFTKVNANVNDIGVTYEEFVTNVKVAFDRGGAIATNTTCKLMGLEFLYFLLTIKTETMNGMITDMTFLAQKKNIRAYDTFGPFIKIS